MRDWQQHLRFLCGPFLFAYISLGLLSVLECHGQLRPTDVFAKHIHLTERERITQIRLGLSQSVRVEIFSLPHPYRLVLDFPTVDFSAIQETTVDERTLVRSFRSGLIAPNRSRLVFDARGPFKLVDARAELGADGTNHIILDLSAVGATAFRPQGVPPRLPRAAALHGLRPSIAEGSAKQSALRKAANFVIVVDPGHGGTDPGAVGVRQTMEKNIVLDVGLKLARTLSERQNYRIFLTRNKDIFVSLDDRVSLAQTHKADLFISLHADAVGLMSSANNVRGASVYTLARFASDERAKELAAKENASDALAGLPIAPWAARGRVEAILFDLMRRETADFSLRLREHLVRRLRRSIRMSGSPSRSANFRVLRQPETPSVLIELGYMSNAKDVRELTQTQWQARAAMTIAQAVDIYYEDRNR